MDYISIRDNAWKRANLKPYDAVIYTAAIVHRKAEVPLEVYDTVNAQQPFEFAQAAKAAGVKQFVFLNIAGVYGQKLPTNNVVDENTPLKPFQGMAAANSKASR